MNALTHRLIILCVLLGKGQVYSQVLYSDDFESGHLLEWSNAEDWSIDGENPIAGDFSLKHNVYNRGGSSFIYREFQGKEINSGNWEWEFTLRNGDWSIDEAVRFYMFLAIDLSEPELTNGFAAGVNFENGSKYLSIYRFKRGEPVEELVRSKYLWRKASTRQVKVKRDSCGNWELLYKKPDDTEWTESPAGKDEVSHLSVKHSGLYFMYSSGEGGQLWFDNFLMKVENTAPYIRRVEAFSDNEVLVVFSDKMDYSELLKIENYTIKAEGEEEIEIRSLRAEEGVPGVVLSFDHIDSWSLELSVSNVTDLYGNRLENNTVNFFFTPPAPPYRVVFNEIMADPTPSQGLPECEYLELVNISEFPVKMQEWTLHIDKKQIALPETIMQPREYLLLVTAKNVEEMEKYGKVIGLDNFTLRNSGTVVSLTKDDIIIDRFEYLPDYHGNEFDEGGWSLEKIDFQRNCDDENNWQTSKADSGGTPGKINSETYPNTDTTPPYMYYAEAVNHSTVAMFFSEPIDSLCLKKDNFILAGGSLEIETIVYRKDSLMIKLQLAGSPLINGNRYNLEIIKLIDLCGNVSANVKGNFLYYIPSSGDALISELLFNPLPYESDFVEIYNNSDYEIDVSRLYLATRDDLMVLENIYQIADSRKFLNPGELTVLTTDSLSVINTYYTGCMDCIIEMNKLPGFPDDEGRVVLLNEWEEVLDELYYNEDMHNPLLTNLEGVSLERIDFQRGTGERGNWHSGSSSTGFATPGYIDNIVDEKREDVFRLESRIFSPNDDGYNDRLGIYLSPGEPNWIANVTIYSPAGIEVRRLLKNHLLSPGNYFEWDGQNENGTKQDLGIYIIVVKLFNTTGETMKFKDTIVISDKLK